MIKVELELITSEVELARAALRLRAHDASQPSAAVYERLAEKLETVGLYEFTKLELVCISVALHELSELAGQIGMTGLSSRALKLSDDFLHKCLMTEPVEMRQQLAQAIESRRKAGVRSVIRPTGFVSRLAAAVGIARPAAGNQVRPL